MRTAIVTDSTFYMENAYIEKHNIFRVPLFVNFENVSYKESDYDQTIMPSIMDRVDATKVLPKTSQPATSDFVTMFEEIKEKGYERILVFTISSNISGTYQGATVAANMFNENNADMVEVYDSRNVAMAGGFAVREIIRYMEKVDYEIDSKVIHDIIDFYAEHSKTFFAVDTLDYLSYGGRISPALAAVGNLFNIKPLLICENGEIKEYTKVRSNKKVLKIINDEFEKVSYDHGYLCVAHCLNDKDARVLQKFLSNALGDIELLPTAKLGPVVSVHTGPGTIAAVWGPHFF